MTEELEKPETLESSKPHLVATNASESAPVQPRRKLGRWLALLGVLALGAGAAA